MGAVFFMTLLLIVFLLAAFFMVLNLILIIVWRVKKKKGNKPRKWWLIMASVFLGLIIVLAAIPVGYVGFLRVSNQSLHSEEDVVKVEDQLEWPMGEYEPTTQWFEYKGKKYVRFRKGFSDEDFYLDYGRDKLGQPIANIKYPKDEWFNNLMWVLLSGKSYADQNISTISPVINDHDFDFLYAELRATTPDLRGDTYHEASTIEATKAYYNNLNNYNTGMVECHYAVNRDMSKVDENSHVNDYEWVDYQLEIDESIFPQLKDLKKETDTVIISMPKRPEEGSPLAEPGLPHRGYYDVTMKVRSLDGMAEKEVTFVYIEGKVYLSSSSSGGELTVYPLTDELNDYMIQNIIEPLEAFQ